MSTYAGLAGFRRQAQTFNPDSSESARTLALYAAAIALADNPSQEALILLSSRYQLQRHHLYEIVLQSYLFLGFPRMLQAAETLDKLLPAPGLNAGETPPESLELWTRHGLQLCRKVYGDSFEPLRNRVESMAPDIFRWMITEGYGKVLSRPGVGIIDRELATVAMLLAENREQQLYSHMRGALNVGAAPALLRTVIDDLVSLVDGYATASQLLSRLKVI